jgi:2-haloalkanoic acid dehalogenase type II
MDLADYEALSFDCYGTLIDWEAGIAAVLTAWARENGLDQDAEALLTAYADLEAATEAAQPGARYPQVLAASFCTLGKQLDVPVTAEWAAELGNSVPDWPAFPDSAGALASLARQYKLIIVSNVHRAGFAASNERLGVSFDRIITAQDVGSYKPARAHFDALQRAADELGVAPGRLLHVAQSLFHDHVPARSAGLPTVWINRRHDRPGWGATPEPAASVTPDWTFPSMQAFADAAAASAALPRS